jgi:hypothetical protein
MLSQFLTLETGPASRNYQELATIQTPLAHCFCCEQMEAETEVPESIDRQVPPKKGFVPEESHPPRVERAKMSDLRFR